MRISTEAAYNFTILNGVSKPGPTEPVVQGHGQILVRQIFRMRKRLTPEQAQARLDLVETSLVDCLSRVVPRQRITGVHACCAAERIAGILIEQVDECQCSFVVGEPALAVTSRRSVVQVVGPLAKRTVELGAMGGSVAAISSASPVVDHFDCL